MSEPTRLTAEEALAHVQAAGGARNLFLRQALVLSKHTEELWRSTWPRLGTLDQQTFIVSTEWLRYGAQSVHLPQTYAAALMATDAREALHDQQLPWPTFEVLVPAELLHSSDGVVANVLVCQAPGFVEFERYSDRRLCITYFDTAGLSGSRRYESLRSMFDCELERADTELLEWIGDSYDNDMENRLWAMIARLVGGVVLAIAAARVERPHAFSGGGDLRTKRDKIRPNTFTLGKPLKLDCRQAVRDFVAGHRSSSPKVTTLVRGHWRQQPCGPRNSLRIPKWIQPFIRGEGPLLMRPTMLKEATP